MNVSAPRDRMTDFAAARRHMVDGQVRTADVTDLRIHRRHAEIPRERFVPPASRGACLSRPRCCRSSAARRLLKPMVFAKLVQAAEIERHRSRAGCRLRHRLRAAVLARLAGSVVALEEDAASPHIATPRLAIRRT